MSKGRRPRRGQQRFQRYSLPGAAPGSFEIDPQAPRPIVHLMAYGPGPLVEERIDKLERIADFRARYQVVWVNVEGLGDAATIRELGRLFGLHPLALEDVVHVHQRPKAEVYGDHVYLVARMVELHDELETEQLSLFLGARFVLTFLEDPGDSFNPVRDRLRAGQGKVLSCDATYLAYSLLDATIDAYFPVVEQFGDRMERLEDEVIERADRGIVARIHAIKRDLRVLRRALWPLREMLNELTRAADSLVEGEVRIYLRDCQDHTTQLIDMVEMYRELGADLTDLYLSSQGHRLNEVMKVLTIISTVFMPLTLVVGVYGMNFNTQASPLNMPELNWIYGYPFALALMAAISVGMLLMFRRIGWLGGGSTLPPPHDEPSVRPAGESATDVQRR